MRLDRSGYNIIDTVELGCGVEDQAWESEEVALDNSTCNQARREEVKAGRQFRCE